MEERWNDRGDGPGEGHQPGDRLHLPGSAGPDGIECVGTTAGTVLVKAIDPDGASITRIGSTLFFAANDGTSGWEVWKSDGTTAGTVLIADICPGACSSSPWQLAAVGSTLFFAANDGVTGWELWKSDGTAAGTVFVKDIDPDPADYGSISFLYPPPAAVGSTLFFVANDGTDGIELWESDGTTAGTVIVKDICPGGCDAFDYLNPPVPLLTAVGSTLLFVAGDPTSGSEMWKSDGTNLVGPRLGLPPLRR
ncbi:MAG: hypothetical protein E6K18_08925 [Methanobacteriota archaeon]|nr:MAG: hypothetical protein E6K18_08925 [Euryarchaeota archaeon]